MKVHVYFYILWRMFRIVWFAAILDVTVGWLLPSQSAVPVKRPNSWIVWKNKLQLYSNRSGKSVSFSIYINRYIENETDFPDPDVYTCKSLSVIMMWYRSGKVVYNRLFLWVGVARFCRFVDTYENRSRENL